MISRSRSAARFKIASARNASRPRPTIAANSSAASRMSASLCSSERLRFAPDVRVARLQSANRNDIDGKTKQRRELVLEMEQVEQRTADFEVNEEVNVARGRVFTSGDRAKECRGPAPVLSHERVDLVSSCFDDRPPVTHGEIVSAPSWQAELRAAGTSPEGSKAVSSSPRLSALSMCRTLAVGRGSTFQPSSSATPMSEPTRSRSTSAASRLAPCRSATDAIMQSTIPRGVMPTRRHDR